MNFFIVKQLPVLPPETYLEEACQGIRYVEMVVSQSPRTDVYILRPTGVCPRFGLRRAALDLGRGAAPLPQVRT